MYQNSISFLFPLHNEEERIKSIGDFILFAKKNFKKFKLVFILNKCTDDTQINLNNLLKNNIVSNFEIIESNKKSRGSGINKTLKKINDEYYAICSVDSAWDYNFYLDAIDLMNKNNSIDIVYGPKNHKKSIIKKTLIRKIISYSSYIFLQILFPLSFKHETQCIKVFKSKLRFFKFLHDYNYFAEAEFFFLSKLFKYNYEFLPTKVNIKFGSKVNMFRILQFILEAIHFRFYLLKNKQNLLRNLSEKKS